LDLPLHRTCGRCRCLEGGAKVYAFHTLNLHTRACAQTIAADKTTATVSHHALQTWKSLGIPTFLQLDNYAAFNGGYKVPRVFGQFVRLALYVGIELIRLRRAGRRTRMQRRYRTIQPALGQGFLRASARPDGRDLSARQPHLRPVVPHPPRAAQTGRPHAPGRSPCRRSRSVARPVADHCWPSPFRPAGCPDGTIALLNESWPVGKRWAGKYVWATITTHSRRLDIWYQRSIQHDWQLLKSVDYDLPNPVAHHPIAFRP